MTTICSLSPAGAVSLLRRLLLLVAAGLGLALTAAAQTGPAVITGRVLNPATGEYIRNAEVRIQGSPQIAVTEGDGYYRITNAPTGELTLVVTYTGHEPVTAKVNV